MIKEQYKINQETGYCIIEVFMEDYENCNPCVDGSVKSDMKKDVKFYFGV